MSTNYMGMGTEQEGHKSPKTLEGRADSYILTNHNDRYRGMMEAINKSMKPSRMTTINSNGDPRRLF